MKEISNRSATYHFAIEQKYMAGMVLTGTEIKSIRSGKVSFNDSFCIIHAHEVYIKSLYIAEYEKGSLNNHNPIRDRKLLLTKKEIKKLVAKTNEKGFTIIPLKIVLNEKGLAKIEIALAKGKKLYDKRDSIKAREVQRNLLREIK